MPLTAPPSITPAPLPAPQRNDRNTFSDRVDAFVTWIIAAVSQFSAVAVNVFDNATIAFTSATNAAASAAAAAASSGATIWVSGTPYNLGEVRFSPTTFKSYRRKNTGSGTVDPATDTANWSPVTDLTGTMVTSALGFTPADAAATTSIANGGTGATTAANARTNLGVPSLTGLGVSGNWAINITGNAATANSATTAGSATTATTAANTTSVAGALAGAWNWTGINQFISTQGSGAYTHNNNNQSLNALSNDGGCAGMTFLRAGSYGVNFGLDPDNVVRLGGYSAPANVLQIDMAGNLTVNANVTAYSDERLKSDWTPLQDDFLLRWASVKCGTYIRTLSGERQVGLSAQSVQRIIPEAVLMNADGYLSLNYGAAAAVATVALAEKLLSMQQVIIDLQNRLTELESI